MIPCRPAMTFWSIVGHAIVQTAAPMGPSTIARLNLRCGLGASATRFLVVWSWTCEFTTQLGPRAFTPAVASHSRAEHVSQSGQPQTICAVGQKARGESGGREVVHLDGPGGCDGGGKRRRFEEPDER